MSKRKKTSVASPPAEVAENESVTTRAVPAEVMEQATGEADEGAASPDGESEGEASHEAPRGPAATEIDLEPPELVPESAGLLVDTEAFDSELTVNLVGDPLPGRDDLDEPTATTAGETIAEIDSVLLQRKHLRGLLEALVFASDSPITPKELAKLASAPQKQVKELLDELQADFSARGIHLDEVAGGWVFRTSPQYAPFVRDLTKQKPVRLTRAQVETLAIIAYRQPITRPEIDDVRGVDSGPVLKLLLERDLVRILGKRDEPGRPLIYGSTSHFLEFFGLKSLKDLPTLREFTELSDESREAFEDELGEAPEDAERSAQQAEAHANEDRGLGEHEAGDDAGTQVDRGEGGEHGEGASNDLDDDDDDDDDDDLDDDDELDDDEEPSSDDDLEPVDVAEGEEPIEGDEGGEPSDDDGDEKHAADDDGPTLTSEAPTTDDE